MLPQTNFTRIAHNSYASNQQDPTDKLAVIRESTSQPIEIDHQLSTMPKQSNNYLRISSTFNRIEHKTFNEGKRKKYRTKERTFSTTIDLKTY